MLLVPFSVFNSTFLLSYVAVKAYKTDLTHYFPLPFKSVLGSHNEPINSVLSRNDLTFNTDSFPLIPAYDLNSYVNS